MCSSSAGSRRRVCRGRFCMRLLRHCTLAIPGAENTDGITLVQSWIPGLLLWRRRPCRWRSIRLHLGGFHA